MKRTKTGQRKHDKAVFRSAKGYEGQGYRVKADLPGFKKPKKIGGFIPDIFAQKGKKEKIVEIETRDTNKKDVKQHNAFKRYAYREGRREFRKRIV